MMSPILLLVSVSIISVDGVGPSLRVTGQASGCKVADFAGRYVFAGQSIDATFTPVVFAGHTTIQRDGAVTTVLTRNSAGTVERLHGENALVGTLDVQTNCRGQISYTNGRNDTVFKSAKTSTSFHFITTAPSTALETAIARPAARTDNCQDISQSAYSGQGWYLIDVDTWIPHVGAGREVISSDGSIATEDVHNVAGEVLDQEVPGTIALVNRTICQFEQDYFGDLYDLFLAEDRGSVFVSRSAIFLESGFNTP